METFSTCSVAFHGLRRNIENKINLPLSHEAQKRKYQKYHIPYTKRKRKIKQKAKTIFYACCRSMSIELCNRQLATVHFAPGPAAHLPIPIPIDVVSVVVIVISIEVHWRKPVPKVANIIIIIVSNLIMFIVRFISLENSTKNIEKPNRKKISRGCSILAWGRGARELELDTIMWMKLRFIFEQAL